MPQTISVVILDSNNESINRMVDTVKNLGNTVSVEGTATSFDSGYELIHKKKPSVVILEIEKDVDLSIERIKQILSRFPQISVFATSEDKSSETILKVMRSGATEYLVRPVAETDLAFAFQKLERFLFPKTAARIEQGRIFTVFSPKGGVGVTTIAINLAVDIHEATKKPTIIVDLDLNAGDVTTFLNMKTTYTISDVTANISRLDKSFLQGVIAKHDSGIFVLAEPQRIEEGVSISGTEIEKVLGLLKTMFSYIIIDAESVTHRTTTAIKMSDIVLLVFYMSLPSIKNIKRHIKFFERTGLVTDRMKIVANRYIKKGEIRVEDAVKALGYPISWIIPNDYNTAMSCLNKGVPFFVGAPKSQLHTSMKEITTDLVKIRL